MIEIFKQEIIEDIEAETVEEYILKENADVYEWSSLIRVKNGDKQYEINYNFDAHVKTITPAFLGTYQEPPHGAEYEVEIHRVEIDHVDLTSCNRVTPQPHIKTELQKIFKL